MDYVNNILDSSINASRVHLNQIVGAMTIIEQSDKYKGDEVISNLISAACKLLSHNMNISYIYYDNLLDLPDSAVDITEIIKPIIAECSGMLEPIERELQLAINCKDSLVRINEKVLTLAIMNLLQNALLYSIPKSPVIITLENADDYIYIGITNLVGLNQNFNEEESFGLGIPLCKKIAERHKGELEYTIENGKNTVKLMLPIEKEDSGLSLNSEFTEYVSERFKPTRLFMTEVLSKYK